jgi:hypothetical protein
VLRLVVYATTGTFEAHRTELDGAAASLRPADLCAVTLRRIQLVDAGPLRLREFLAAWPSAAPDAAVALVNGLDPADRGAVMPRPAKRIVETTLGCAADGRMRVGCRTGHSRRTRGEFYKPS